MHALRTMIIKFILYNITGFFASMVFFSTAALLFRSPTIISFLESLMQIKQPRPYF
jgi:hypothetical protein